MNTEVLSLVAGMISTTIFATSHFPMIWKAFRTKDMASYSFAHFVLVNSGNFIHWIYVITLPVGPIWMLHAFYTVSSVLMLAMYVGFVIRRRIVVGAKEIQPSIVTWSTRPTRHRPQTAAGVSPHSSIGGAAQSRPGRMELSRARALRVAYALPGLPVHWRCDQG